LALSGSEPKPIEFISEVVFNHDEIKLTGEDLWLSGKFQATFKTKLMVALPRQGDANRTTKTTTYRREF